MKLKYEYDFGDSWEHDIVVEKVLEAAPLAVYPRCTAGAGNCPPEDCGGVWGFYGLLETIRDPKHPEYHDMKEWLGGDYDPDAFSLDGVNSRLRPLIRERKGRGTWVLDK